MSQLSFILLSSIVPASSIIPLTEALLCGGGCDGVGALAFILVGQPLLEIFYPALPSVAVTSHMWLLSTRDVADPNGNVLEE